MRQRSTRLHILPVVTALLLGTAASALAQQRQDAGTKRDPALELILTYPDGN